MKNFFRKKEKKIYELNTKFEGKELEKIQFSALNNKPKYDVNDEIIFRKDGEFEKSYLFEGKILKVKNKSADEVGYLVYIGNSETWIINESQILFKKDEEEVLTLNSITEKCIIDSYSFSLGDIVSVKGIYRYTFIGNMCEEQVGIGTIRRIKRDYLTKKYKFLVSLNDGNLVEVSEEKIKKVD
ncbi:hypothetical protein UT300003_32900 [Clostridium sardiniense]